MCCHTKTSAQFAVFCLPVRLARGRLRPRCIPRRSLRPLNIMAAKGARRCMAGVGKKSKRKAPWGGRPRVKDPKDKRVNLRCTSAQFEQLDKAASRAGLSLGAFSRAMLLKKPGPRAVRRPPVEKQSDCQAREYIRRAAAAAGIKSDETRRSEDADRDA